MDLISWYDSVNKGFQSSLVSVGSGILDAVKNIGADPVNATGTGSGNPIPGVIDKVSSGDLAGAGSDLIAEVVQESATLANSGKQTVIDPAIDWVNTSVVDPAIDWTKDNVTNPIGQAWDKYKISIIAGIGTIALIKLLK